MPIPKMMNAQTDFSAGQLNVDIKRSDDPIIKAGARQMVNWRILNTKRAQQRPGRRARFTVPFNGRVDDVRVLPAVIYRLYFGGDGSFKIYDASGVLVATNVSGPFAWRDSTIDEIVWTIVRTSVKASDVVVTFPGQKPVIASFDGIATWTFPTFAFAADGAGVQLAPFFRVAAPGITLLASGSSGAVTLTASSAVFVPLHPGSLIRVANRRLLITALLGPTGVNATWQETAYPQQTLTMAARTGAVAIPIAGFAVGQIVLGETSNVKGEITSINAGASELHVQCIDSLTGFLANEILVGPTASAVVNAVAAGAMEACLTWDEQMISDARGWPQSCTTDQGRLIFTDMPSTSNAIIWSGIDQPYNMTPGPQPTDAMIELIVGNPHIYHVLGGLQETVFTDKGVYYIPISEISPLKPGSVVFRLLTPDPASQVRPLDTSEAILYVNAGRSRLIAIVPTGVIASTKPYFARDVTEHHYDLLNQPKALALSSGDGQFPERHIYVVNGDGTVVVGRYQGSLEKEYIGWLPWTGRGTVNWLSALQSVVMFTTRYIRSGIQEMFLAETLDDATYLDASIQINAVPPGMAPPPGKGPLWWFVSGTVDLMDGRRSLGHHAIDGDGFVVTDIGEDISATTITAGQFWDTQVLEPFEPPAPGGQDQQQRMRRRRIARAGVSVEASTGFVFARLYSGPDGANLPAQGSVVQQRRVPAYHIGDDQNLPPPLRETTVLMRPLGRTYDPRMAIIKDIPGPIRVLEYGAAIGV